MYVQNVELMLDCNPDFFETFNVVIATNLPDK